MVRYTPDPPSKRNRRVHAEGVRERNNMRDARREVDPKPFELAALSNGEELYRTELFESRAAAEEGANEANQRIEEGKVFEHEGETVDEFIVVETEK